MQLIIEARWVDGESDLGRRGRQTAGQLSAVTLVLRNWV
jgi:hypothetical protein